MPTSPTIFGSYDIRGIFPDQLNEKVAEDISRGVATLLQREHPGKHLTVVVGRDMRLSSPVLHTAVINGLTASGANVIDVGLVSTPTFYFAVAKGGYDGGIQITASHNPKEYNGLKIVRARSIAIGRNTGMSDLQQIVERRQFTEAAEVGVITMIDRVAEDCVKTECADIMPDSIKPLKIVADAANAMGALDIEEFFTHFPGQLIKINFELDGSFPVHQPDPLDPNNLRLLTEAVRTHQADLGIAPDGDGDRFFFVDETGAVVRQEILRGIMAQIALAKHPGATVCYDIRPGRITRDMIEAVGGRAIVTPVGHALIKNIMLKEDAIYGGESSGHHFYRFSYGTFEAPMVLTGKFLQWLTDQKLPLSAAIKPYKKYFHSGEINSRVHEVATTLTRVQQKYSDGAVNLLDGVTIEYPTWWFNVRGSNTEPLVRLNLEATTSELMAHKRDEVLTVIRATS